MGVRLWMCVSEHRSAIGVIEERFHRGVFLESKESMGRNRRRQRQAETDVVVCPIFFFFISFFRLLREKQNLLAWIIGMSFPSLKICSHG